MFFLDSRASKEPKPSRRTEPGPQERGYRKSIIHGRNLCCIFLSAPSRIGDDILLDELTTGWKRAAGREKLIMLLEKAL